MIAQLRHLLSVLRGRIPHHLVCTVCAYEVREITPQEKAVLLAHRRLLCPCGGSLMSVHPALSKYRPGGVVR